MLAAVLPVEAQATGASVGEIVLRRCLLSQEALDEILRPEKLARPHAE